MKKITILLILVAIVFSSCNYLRKKGIIGTSKKDKEYIESLKNTIHEDSIENAAIVEQLQKESQGKIDSLQKICSACSGTYNVITGSFRNPLNADNFEKEMKKLGYKAQIVQAANGFNLVSAFSANNLKEALIALNNLRTNVNPESWIYVK
jgi:hypothetical protein